MREGEGEGEGEERGEKKIQTREKGSGKMRTKISRVHQPIVKCKFGR